MDGLLAFCLAMLALTGVGLWWARRWLDRTDRRDDHRRPP